MTSSGLPTLLAAIASLATSRARSALGTGALVLALLVIATGCAGSQRFRVSTNTADRIAHYEPTDLPLTSAPYRNSLSHANPEQTSQRKTASSQKARQVFPICPEGAPTRTPQQPSYVARAPEDRFGEDRGGARQRADTSWGRIMHPDHLGSTSFVTDRDGGLYEHVAYFPFGETWVEEASDTEDIPYLFTGKELDQETGLYYFGARYYDPRTSVWESADPAWASQFSPHGLSLYSYSFHNPLALKDPDGRWPTWADAEAAAKFVQNEAENVGGWGAGLVEEAVRDTAATAATMAAHNPTTLFLSGNFMEAGKQAVAQVDAIQNSPQILWDELAGFGDSFAQAAAADGTPREAGAAAWQPVKTAMDIAAKVIGAADSIRGTFAEGGCSGGQCGGKGVCFVAGTLVQTPSGTVPIEDIRLGDRVEAGNAACSDDHIDPSAVTIVVTMPNPTEPSDLVRMRIVRPLRWLDETGFVDGTGWVDLGEIGLAGWATVDSIEEAPLETPGNGCLVLMTVEHIGARVIRLRFDDRLEVLELTPGHPLYLEGVGWTEAGELRVGDWLRSDSGPVRVRAIEETEPNQRVFNFEVGREHAYRVGDGAFWAHNPPCEPGSYTNTHESGRTYSGKGDRARSQTSGARIALKTGDPHVATDWTPAETPREAFKDESRRIDANGGAKGDNHNAIESPGKKYRTQDGDE